MRVCVERLDKEASMLIEGGRVAHDGANRLQSITFENRIDEECIGVRKNSNFDIGSEQAQYFCFQTGLHFDLVQTLCLQASNMMPMVCKFQHEIRPLYFKKLISGLSTIDLPTTCAGETPPL